MMTAIRLPRVTRADLIELIDSPAESPVLYLDDDLDLAVGPRAAASEDSIILDRSALLDAVGRFDEESRVSVEDLDEEDWAVLEAHFMGCEDEIAAAVESHR
jgi:hypothetical protein